MKRWILGLMLLCTAFTIGCQQEAHKETQYEVEDTQLVAESSLLLESYFPIAKDWVWVYYDQQTRETLQVSVEYLKNGKAQLRMETPKNILTKVYMQSEDGIYEVYEERDNPKKQDYTDAPQYQNAILRLPLDKGHSWKVGTKGEAEITKLDKKLQLPIGEVAALEVTLEVSQGTYKTYFAPKWGIVKLVYEGEDRDYTYELQRVERDVPTPYQVGVYQVENATVAYKEETAWVRTNEEPKHFLTDIVQKNRGTQSTGTMEDMVLINEIKIMDHTAYMDISNDHDSDKELDKNMIKSLVYTVGNYYEVPKVLLFKDGVPYQQGIYEDFANVR